MDQVNVGDDGSAATFVIAAKAPGLPAWGLGGEQSCDAHENTHVCDRITNHERGMCA